MAIQFEIHPSIGVARLGTSDEFFLGPAPGVTPPASYRDAAKRLKKQAAHFQVFRCDRDAAGKLLSPPELITNAIGQIRWMVEVANRKAVAFKLTNPAARRNNASGNDAADAALIVKTTPLIVDDTTPDVKFAGDFRGLAVTLGRAIRQADGSLIFTGGSGISGKRPAAAGPPPNPGHFADNDDWFDDTCEGPVRAEVKLADGSTHVALAARVVVGPPDFAPDVQPWVNLHDIAYQAAIDRAFLTAETEPSYVRFIRPFLLRAKDFPWVNQHSGQGHGGSAQGNFSDAKLAMLGNPAGPAVIRNGILGRFRNPATPIGSAPSSPSRSMPRLFSEEGYLENKHLVLALPPVIFSYFQLWAAGHFKGDTGTSPFAGESIVDALDRVAMEACIGGGFFPGIEVPRFVRDKNVWASAFRLDPNIPAGHVTEGLAVPWQADFSACQWEDSNPTDGITDPTDPNGYAWWPAQRPDHVFASAADVTANHRSNWDRGAASAIALINNQTYAKLGIVRRKGTVMIETERELP